MARRSVFVAIAALGAVLFPVSAYAATIAVTSAQFASPVTLSWDLGLNVTTQSLFRISGACPATPSGGTLVVTDGDPSAMPPTLPTLSGFTDTPGEGPFCYYIVDNLGTSNGAPATVDTVAPTASVTVGYSTVAPYVRGAAVVITAASNDATAPPVIHEAAAAAGCTAASPVITSPWNTLPPAVADGASVICVSATDPALHTGMSAVVPVTVDNTLPTGAITAPIAGASVRGTIPLTSTAADANPITVVWTWTQAAANALAAGATTWATTTAVDGAATLTATVTDAAGNVFVTPAVSVAVDNTIPDLAPILTAPPAVAGSPTLVWTAAHDAVGIDHYIVTRSANGGAAVALPQVASLSQADLTAPDHATLTYHVTAYDRAGNASVASNAATVLTDSTAVSAPRSLSATTPTSGSPTLNWQAPITFNVQHYDIYRDGRRLDGTTGTQTTYTDTSATEGAHDYAVLALDPNPGVLSASFHVVVDRTAPTSGGAPTAQLLPGDHVQLNWPIATDALSGISGYVVRRASGGVPPATADGGTAVCAPTAAGCTDTTITSGTWSYGVFARDGAGNVGLIGTVPGVVILDKTAPLAPTKLKLTQAKAKKSKVPSTSITYTLRWAKPTAPDLDRIVLVLNLAHAPSKPSDGRSIYHGLGTSAKIKLKAGQTAYLALFAYDHAGNFSAAPARKVINLASLIPLRPLTGSVVRTSTPMLTWTVAKGASYYNLQLFINGRRALVAWPSNAHYKIPAGKVKAAGTYVWYVWPFVAQKTGGVTFGKLIGRATFVFKK